MRVENVDLESAQGFVLLEPGIHLVTVESGKEGKSKAGERKVDFLSIVMDGPQAGGNITLSFSLQPQALWKLRQFRDACGIGASGGNFFDTDDFIGRSVKIATSQKTFTNDTGKSETRTQIDDFMAAA